MPDYNKSTIRVLNKDRSLNRPVFDDIIHKYYNEYTEYFDFNKIVPMPPELSVKCVVPETRMSAIYLTCINPYITYPTGVVKMDVTEYDKLITDLVERDAEVLLLDMENYSRYDPKTGLISEKDFYKYCPTVKDVTELSEYGKSYITNFLKFGYSTWYDWRYDNWGTKWNATDASISSDSCEILLRTANGVPVPIVVALASQYPDAIFEITWHQDNTGETEPAIYTLMIRNNKIISRTTKRTERCTY